MGRDHLSPHLLLMHKPLVRGNGPMPQLLFWFEGLRLSSHMQTGQVWGNLDVEQVPSGGP